MFLPMKPKYVDEAAETWFVFGVHKNGKVDVSAEGRHSRDVFTEIPKETADKVVALHDKFVKDLYELLCE